MNSQAKRTQERIINAFLELLRTKSINHITIREIAEKAEITRVSFYTHFQDIYDLLAYIQEQMVQDISTFLQESIASHNSMEFAEKLFAYFDENRDRFLLLSSKTFDSDFLFNTFQAMKETHEQEGEHYQKHRDMTDNDAIIDYQFVYMSGGVFHMLLCWIKQDDGMNRESVARLAAAFNSYMGAMKLPSNQELTTE